MVHPDLPPTQVIEVESLAVPHYRASGWVDAPEPAAAESGASDDTQKPAPDGEAAAESDPDAPKQRRTTTKKESDQR